MSSRKEIRRQVRGLIYDCEQTATAARRYSREGDMGDRKYWQGRVEVWDAVRDDLQTLLNNTRKGKKCANCG